MASSNLRLRRRHWRRKKSVHLFLSSMNMREPKVASEHGRTQVQLWPYEGPWLSCHYDAVAPYCPTWYPPPKVRAPIIKLCSLLNAISNTYTHTTLGMAAHFHFLHVVSNEYCSGDLIHALEDSVSNFYSNWNLSSNNIRLHNCISFCSLKLP